MGFYRDLSKEIFTSKDSEEVKQDNNHDIKVTREVKAEVSTVQWLVHMIAFCLPIVNLVYAVYLICSKDTNQTTKNWAKVALSLATLFTIIYFIICWQIASNWNDFMM